MKINLVGAFSDSSGYAQFARSWATAMHRANWDVSIEQISFEHTHADHGAYGEICKSLLSKPCKTPDINIINMIPKVYQSFIKPNSMNIGFTMFETSKIPPIWVQQCNRMDAILVPCQWNKEVFISSGVTVPVEVASPGIDPALYPAKRQKNIDNADFKFYSIFQWSERKNPAALVRAFTSAFAGNTHVSLTLKTYLKDYSKDEFEFLHKEIFSIRSSIESNLSHPRIIIKHEKLTDQQIINMHMTNDCFVLPTRAEGFGLPYIEAMMIGNPTIGTRYSGNLEFMNDDNSYLIDYQLEPVYNMRHLGGWYTSDMRWAQPNIDQLADKMIYVYNHQKEARALAASARSDLLHRLNWAKQLESFNTTLQSLYKSWLERRR
jgi:glycosyltransferase involved in cell wall biosynthesis